MDEGGRTGEGGPQGEEFDCAIWWIESIHRQRRGGRAVNLLNAGTGFDMTAATESSLSGDPKEIYPNPSEQTFLMSIVDSAHGPR